MQNEKVIYLFIYPTMREMMVEHPTYIPSGIPVEFKVVVSEKGTPPIQIPLARVCLYKPSDIYEIGWTDNEGIAVFEIIAKEPGYITVTVTYPRNKTFSYIQYIPSQTYCEVVSSSGGGQGKSF